MIGQNRNLTPFTLLLALLNKFSKMAMPDEMMMPAARIEKGNCTLLAERDAGSLIPILIGGLNGGLQILLLILRQ